jgi:hypothetical protein
MAELPIVARYAPKPKIWHAQIMPLDMQVNTCISFTTLWTSAKVFEAMAGARRSLP